MQCKIIGKYWRTSVFSLSIVIKQNTIDTQWCVLLGHYHYYFNVFNQIGSSVQIQRNNPRKKIKDGKAIVLVNWVEVIGDPKDEFGLINLGDYNYNKKPELLKLIDSEVTNLTAKFNEVRNFLYYLQFWTLALRFRVKTIRSEN